MHGTYTGNVPANERLSIPALKMQDGPQGFRSTENTGGTGTSTAWPSALTIAASWDQDLLNRWATAMAEEFGAKGANMALAPGIGIARVPTAGRNFEYLCGEDPSLGAMLVRPVVRGIQDQGIIANAKHYINNEIETHRMLVSSNVDERTRFELYYPPFQAATEEGVLSVMCSYNRINDVYACQNEETLNHLREQLGFKGWVVSDWTATKSTAKSLHAGMDMEMPIGVFYSSLKLEISLKAGEISMEEIDKSVYRVLYAMKAIGLFDRAPSGDPMANVTSDAHNALAREISAKATVLLKNEGNVLPLIADTLGSCIAVFGDQNTISGGGSGSVSAPYVITTTQGLINALTSANSKTEVIYNAGTDLTEAASLAAQCSTAIVMATTTSCEGSDRKDLSLGNNQDELITTVAAANKRTIVALDVPGAVLMPWADLVPAILVAWMPGQEAGNALADILFGKVNPSARLPVTMPNKDNEIAFTKEEFPGTGFPPEAAYNEQLLIGYRWYDAMNVVPRFAFGHGLSYTSFEYKNLHVRKLSEKFSLARSMAKPELPSTPHVLVEFILQNTGAFDGAEVAQVYLQYPEAAKEPVRQLRTFTKQQLAKGESSTITLTLSKRDCSIWDVTSHRWQVVSGEYTVFVGASSRDLRLQATVTL